MSSINAAIISPGVTGPTTQGLKTQTQTQTHNATLKQTIEKLMASTEQAQLPTVSCLLYTSDAADE